jgi:hypothetical protein
MLRVFSPGLHKTKNKQQKGEGVRHSFLRLRSNEISFPFPVSPFTSENLPEHRYTMKISH